MNLSFDLETSSEADIEEVGAWNYSRHPSTRVLCGAFRIGGEYVNCYDLTTCDAPCEWKLAVQEGWDIWADNCSFEYSIITNVLPQWPQPKLNSWRDFQWVACCAARPVGLAKRAAALGIVEQKDKKGTALINFFCKPISSGGKKGQFRLPAEHPDRFAELMAYCAQDVRTSVATREAMRALTPDELAFCLTTWRRNAGGTAIDTDLVRSLLAMTDTSRTVIGVKLESETGFAAVDISNHAKVLAHVKNAGAVCESVAKAAIKDTLAQDIPEEARLVLEARQALGKTSLAKLDSLLKSVGDDGRLRFLIRPHGAAAGRDTGLGVQPQNLPRGEKGLDPDVLIPLAKAGDTDGFLKNSYRKAGGKTVFDPLGAVVSCIRGCFAAAPSRVLLQCDWASIEPRIAAWIVGDTDILDFFRNYDANGGPDLYQNFVASLMGVDPLTVKGDLRQLGKVGELQNLYESGEKSIQKAAKDMYGLNLDLDICVQLKDVWRAKHPLHTAMWRALNDGAIAATKQPNRPLRCGKIGFCHDGKDLRMRIPSGRLVTFPEARIEPRETPWGTMQDSLVNMTVLHGNWVEDTNHGGSIYNQVVQGTGACLMRFAARNLEAAGFDVVMRVHDELVVEAESEQRFEEFKRIMLTPPPWALDLPINGGGWTGPRFKKD